MSQNISTYIQPTFTLVASATANLDVRLSDVSDMKIYLTQTWPNGTSAPTGVLINLYPGFGGKDPAENANDPIPKVLSNPASLNLSTVPLFADNFLVVSPISQPPAGQATQQITNTSFYLNEIIKVWPSWVRFQIINQDPAKSVNLRLLADI